jgi:hypothetical protein
MKESTQNIKEPTEQQVQEAMGYLTEATVMLDKAMKALGDDPTPCGGPRWGSECTRIFVFASLLDDVVAGIQEQLELEDDPPTRQLRRTASTLPKRDWAIENAIAQTEG